MEPIKRNPGPQITAYIVYVPVEMKRVGPFETHDEAMRWVAGTLGNRVLFAIEELWSDL